jgi:hypothetical protein
MRAHLLLLLFLVSNKACSFGSFAPLIDVDAPVNPNINLLSATLDVDKNAIVNQFMGSPGCYIQCMGPPGGLYPVTNIYWLHGMIRISGHYLTDTPTDNNAQTTCYPDDLQGSFSSYTLFQTLCNKTFSTCNGNCTGSAETGSYFTNTPIS